MFPETEVLTTFFKSKWFRKTMRFGIFSLKIKRMVGSNLPCLSVPEQELFSLIKVYSCNSNTYFLENAYPNKQLFWNSEIPEHHLKLNNFIFV